jgi:1-acyl-sn-glycerol-3-phosphate acyltransferase
VGRSLLLAGLFVGAGWELFWKDPKTRLERADWLHRFCARALKRLDVRVEVEGRFPAGDALIVNHCSYLDIVVLASIHPCVFVSKSEVSAMPVVGWMTTMSGTVYVERGRGGSALKAGRGVQEAADDGLPVVFFPEGTTNTTRTLLKFHSGLIGQVMVEKMPIRAGYLRYYLDENNAAGVTVAEDVCWGTKPLLKHVFELLGLHGLRAEVRFREEPIAFSAAAANRKIAADEARAAVAELGERSGVGVEADAGLLAQELH